MQNSSFFIPSQMSVLDLETRCSLFSNHFLQQNDFLMCILFEGK